MDVQPVFELSHLLAKHVTVHSGKLVESACDDAIGLHSDDAALWTITSNDLHVGLVLLGSFVLPNDFRSDRMRIALSPQFSRASYGEISSVEIVDHSSASLIAHQIVPLGS